MMDSLSLCLFLFFSLTLCLSLCLSLCLFVSLSLSVSLSISHTEVTVKGWNELLALPLIAFPDVFSVSGHCAHNLKTTPSVTPSVTAIATVSASSEAASTITTAATATATATATMTDTTTTTTTTTADTTTTAAAAATAAPSTESTNGWHNIGHCVASELETLHHSKKSPNGLRQEGTRKRKNTIHTKNNTSSFSRKEKVFSYHGFQSAQLSQFFVRDTSNRGPLLLRGGMMRELGFFDEVCLTSEQWPEAMTYMWCDVM